MAKRTTSNHPNEKPESPLVKSLASYSPENLRKSVSTYVMLNNYAQEGLSYENKAQYKEDVKHIKGLYNPDVSKEENASYLKHTTEDYEKGLVSYLSNNFKSAIKEVDEKSLYNIGLKYLPNFKTGNEHFEGLRSIISNCVSKLEQISKNGGDYLKEAIKGKDSFVANAILARSDTYLKVHSDRFNEIMFNKIDNYGLRNFVGDVRESYKVDNSAVDAAKITKERISKEIFEKYNSKMKKDKGYWDDDLQDRFEKELDKNEGIIAADQTIRNYAIYSSIIPSELISPIDKIIQRDMNARESA